MVPVPRLTQLAECLTVELWSSESSWFDSGAGDLFFLHCYFFLLFFFHNLSKKLIHNTPKLFTAILREQWSLFYDSVFIVNDETEYTLNDPPFKSDHIAFQR